MSIMAPMMATIITIKKSTKKSESSPACINLTVLIMALGNRATIPAKIMSDIPFPIPLSVICSPNHMIKAVPDVRVIIVTSLKGHPGFCTNAP